MKTVEDCPPISVLEALVGNSTDGERSVVLAHLDSCVSCQIVVAQLARSGSMTSRRPVRPGPALEPGERVDRFVVVRVLGSGAMGIVYEAIDEELERRVALKLLHPELAVRSDGVDRLQREAKAMARLRHPHIVTIHAVGQSEAGAYIAMERIEGPSLSRVLAEGTSSRDRVWSLFLDAGRALAAAHAAQVVHCDFKPDNVLIDRGDVAKVGDFGLASIDHDAATLSSQSAERGAEIQPAGTHAAGTPRYMAPEVMEGTPASAASDQYSFCYALAEALADRPLSQATTWEALLDAKRTGLAVSSIRASRRVRRALARGLSPDPGRRFASMVPLLRELSLGRRTWRRRGRAVAVVVGVGVAALWATTSEQPCPGAASRIDPVWNPEIRAALLDRASADGSLVLREAVNLISAELDARVDAWGATYEAACADLGRGIGAADATLACLAEDLAAMEALVHAATSSLTSEESADVVLAATVLPQPRTCPERLAAWSGERLDEPQRESMLELREELARADTLAAAGRHEDAGKALARARRLAKSIGALRYVAQVELVAARMEQSAGRFVPALESAREAYRIAVAANADAIAVDAALAVLWLTTRYGRDLDSARDVAEDAQAWVTRLGEPARLRAELLVRRALLATAEGDAEAAERHARAAIVAMDASDADEGARIAALEAHATALADLGRLDDAYEAQRTLTTRLQQRLGAHHRDVAGSLSNLGRMDYQRGDYEGALARFEEVHEIESLVFGPRSIRAAQTLNLVGATQSQLGRVEDSAQTLAQAVAILEEALGPDHAELASSLTNLANALTRLDRLPEAIESYERAVRLREAALGPDHPRLAATLGNLGDALTWADRHAEALAVAERALAISEAAQPVHPQTAFLHSVVSGALRGLERHEDAVDHLEQALEIRREVLGSEHPDLLANYINLGVLLTDIGDFDAARRAYERARDIARAAYGEAHPEYARAVHHLGLVALERGDAAEARTRLQEALALVDAVGAPSARADARLRLAQALSQLEHHRHRARICELADQAVALYDGIGSQYEEPAEQAARLCPDR